MAPEIVYENEEVEKEGIVAKGKRFCKKWGLVIVLILTGVTGAEVGYHLGYRAAEKDVETTILNLDPIEAPESIEE